VAQVPVNGAPRLGTLLPEHLAQAVDLSTALGWPYREADWRFALELGHGVALQSDGHLLGTALWWAYGEQHASMGMIIVAAQLQGRGFGRALTEALLASAGERSIILNSTAAGAPLYASLGFVPYGRVFQHQAVFEASADSAQQADLRPFRPEDEAAVMQLDRAATGTDRSALLRSLFSAGEAWVLERGNGLAGYACVREFGRGLVIGPVVTSSGQDAQGLIASLAARHRGRFLRIDVTEQSGLSPWLTEMGLPCVGDALSMVRGPRAATRGDVGLQALSNQSFG